MMAAQKLVLLHSVRLSEVVEHADRDQRLAAGSRDHTIALRRRSVVHRQIGNRPPRLSKSDDGFARVVESDDSERGDLGREAQGVERFGDHGGGRRVPYRDKRESEARRPPESYRVVSARPKDTASAPAPFSLLR